MNSPDGDGQLQSATTAPALAVLSVSQTVNGVLEFSGIKDIAAAQREAPVAEILAQAGVYAPSALSGTLGGFHLGVIASGGLERHLPWESDARHNAGIPGK